MNLCGTPLLSRDVHLDLDLDQGRGEEVGGAGMRNGISNNMVLTGFHVASRVRVVRLLSSFKNLDCIGRRQTCVKTESQCVQQGPHLCAKLRPLGQQSLLWPRRPCPQDLAHNGQRGLRHSLTRLRSPGGANSFPGVPNAQAARESGPGGADYGNWNMTNAKPSK